MDGVAQDRVGVAVVAMSGGIDGAGDDLGGIGHGQPSQLRSGVYR